MVDKIREMKDQALRRMEQAVSERGVERVDVGEMGKLADIVKDLAEAEKSCWEAEYYRSVTEAMGGDSMGYSQGRGYQMGYRGQPRDSMGQYTSRRGYSDSYGYGDPLGDVRQMMETADPKEREQLRMQLRKMTEM